MKPVLSLFGVVIKSKHSLKILTVIKHVGSKTGLRVSLKSAVGPGVFMESSVLPGMSVLTKDAKVFENVIQIIKGLVVTLSACSLILLGEI